MIWECIEIIRARLDRLALIERTCSSQCETFRDPTELNISRFLSMFGMKKSPRLQGHAYIVLQVIRFCNVAVLLAVMTASVLMLIFAKLPNGFQFFADVVHALVFFFAGLLIFTEIGAWKKGQQFIEASWPMLASEKGFTGLGAIMGLIGCHLLGGLNTSLYTESSVPSQVAQVIIGAGIISLAFGFINIVASLAFRSGATRARAIRSAGATAQPHHIYDDYPSRANSVRKPKISGPIIPPTEPPMEEDYDDHLPPMNHYGDNKSIASVDSQHSPIVPGMPRPPPALHPAHRITQYSEASHLNRFDNSNMV
ncbi:hypothetical protein F5Y17DRAFT_442172 [Xylariaceae sp. FL0594]|nr:hypothetical protein F5Y17DRAFT_442172 [Xylariaceae sp. FL0594]